MRADVESGATVTTIADILARHPVEVQELAQEVWALIKAMMPGVVERAYPGWHAIGFRDAHAGYLCGIFPTARLRAAFHSISVAWYGTELGDSGLVHEGRAGMELVLDA